MAIKITGVGFSADCRLCKPDQEITPTVAFTYKFHKVEEPTEEVMCHEHFMQFLDRLCCEKTLAPLRGLNKVRQFWPKDDGESGA